MLVSVTDHRKAYGRNGGLRLAPAALDECRLMQMRRQEVVAPKMPGVISPMPGSYAHANWPAATVSRLATAQGSGARSGSEFVVREEHLWSVARYMPGSLGNWTAWAYPVAKSAFTVKRCCAGGKSAGIAGRGLTAADA